MKDDPVLIIGAGPAGLTAAYELVKRNIQPIVIEKSNTLGGLARTEMYKGYRFDIGGHRFFTKVKEVEDLWEEMLGQEFLRVHRLSRIYYQDQFYNYPLELFNTLMNLGIIESLLVLWSYIKTHVRPYPKEETFEQWVTNRFGRHLYQKFFKGYTEKVWGIPCHMIQADWAAQRIQGLSLRAVISNALFGSHHAKTLINQFHYPVLGAGIMWHRFQERVEEQGGQIHLNHEVIRMRHEDHSIQAIYVQHNQKEVEIPGSKVISTMSLQGLITCLDPPPPKEVLEAARKLTYRAFILVGLILKHKNLFPDQWIYVHSPWVRVGRIQNYKNWSVAMVPDPGKTSLGMEYFCTEGDETWKMSDTELLELARGELARLGLIEKEECEDGIVFRQSEAYPVYDNDYDQRLQVIKQFLKTIDNLQTVGRNGMHRYNNMDHSMVTAMLAVKNILGANHDLWELKDHQRYLE